VPAFEEVDQVRFELHVKYVVVVVEGGGVHWTGADQSLIRLPVFYPQYVQYAVFQNEGDVYILYDLINRSSCKT
jgi:hypothetical protein